MNRALIFHALLALVGAAAAWSAWQRVDSQDRRATTLVLDLDAADIRSVVHDWPGGTTRVDTDQHGILRDFRLTLESAPQPLPATNRELETPPDSAPIIAPPSHVVTRGIEVLTPLRARRIHHDPDPAQLERLGFADSDREMTVQLAKREISIRFGRETFGGEGRYIRIGDEPVVYLVDAQLARSFEGPASRLIDAQLVPVELDQITSITIALDERRITFEHRDREQPRLRRFVRRDAPDKPRHGIEAVIESLRGLYSRHYVAPDSVSGQPVLSIRIGLARRPELPVLLYAGHASQNYWLESGRWTARLHPVAARKLLEDIRAALPTER